MLIKARSISYFLIMLENTVLLVTKWNLKDDGGSSHIWLHLAIRANLGVQITLLQANPVSVTAAVLTNACWQ